MERPANTHLESVDSGVIVEFVAADTPADAAGLQRGDVIARMGGADINNNGDLLRVLAERQPGDTVTVTYYRNGEQQETRLTLAERPVE
jgi:serine protease Do